MGAADKARCRREDVGSKKYQKEKGEEMESRDLQSDRERMEKLETLEFERTSLVLLKRQSTHPYLVSCEL